MTDEERRSKDLERQVSVLEQELALFKKPSDKRGFYTMQKIINQQVDFLNQFSLSKEISLNPKDEKVYDRAKALWEGLPSLISDTNKLKAELKITGNEDEDTAVSHSFLDGAV